MTLARHPQTGGLLQVTHRGNIMGRIKDELIGLEDSGIAPWQLEPLHPDNQDEGYIPGRDDDISSWQLNPDIGEVEHKDWDNEPAPF